MSRVENRWCDVTGNWEDKRLSRIKETNLFPWNPIVVNNFRPISNTIYTIFMNTKNAIKRRIDSSLKLLPFCAIPVVHYPLQIVVRIVKMCHLFITFFLLRFLVFGFRLSNSWLSFRRRNLWYVSLMLFYGTKKVLYLIRGNVYITVASPPQSGDSRSGFLCFEYRKSCNSPITKPVGMCIIYLT
jgi:hypothetical protein